MPIIPRENYAQAHLDEVCVITGIYDWFDFSDRKDRLIYLMEISRPSMLQLDGDNLTDFTWLCTWEFLGDQEFYGLWIDKTPQEDWLLRQIKKRNREWWENLRRNGQESDEAKIILERFENLTRLARQESLGR